MTAVLPRQRPIDPTPNPGLRLHHFRQICENGFGDGHNSYAHSMSWFDNCLYVGTTRSNFCMLKIFHADSNIAVWPVECPDDIYSLDRRAQIWRYDPIQQQWQQVLLAPMVMGTLGEEVTREIGYRAMTVFQGESDPKPALYVAPWAPGRVRRQIILRSEDGFNFSPMTSYEDLKLSSTGTRLLVPFKDRLLTSPTTATGGRNNFAEIPMIFETRDPVRGPWYSINEPGFGDSTNQGVFGMGVLGDQIYAGTFNNQGFQIWRSDCKGDPPYTWTRVIEKGAYRGPLNQIVATMQAFKGALYVGTGIQGGGYDRINNIGPAAAELIRIWPDDSWDLVVGLPRDTPQGRKDPLSGFLPGFGNFFNGYFWQLGVHDNWLYIATYDSSLILNWLLRDHWPERPRHLLENVGVETIMEHQSGFELWRTFDGENWLPVDRQGFGNIYNVGARNMISSPYGFFLGTANPFGPRVAARFDGAWTYVDNPRGGLEIWQANP